MRASLGQSARSCFRILWDGKLACKLGIAVKLEALDDICGQGVALQHLDLSIESDIVVEVLQTVARGIFEAEDVSILPIDGDPSGCGVLRSHSERDQRCQNNAY